MALAAILFLIAGSMVQGTPIQVPRLLGIANLLVLPALNGVSGVAMLSELCRSCRCCCCSWQQWRFAFAALAAWSAPSYAGLHMSRPLRWDSCS